MRFKMKQFIRTILNLSALFVVFGGMIYGLTSLGPNPDLSAHSVYQGDGVEKTYNYVTSTTNPDKWSYEAIWYYGQHKFLFNADTSMIVYKNATKDIVLKLQGKLKTYTDYKNNGKYQSTYGEFKSNTGDTFVIEIISIDVDYLIIFGHTGFDDSTPITLVYSSRARTEF